MSGFGYNWLGFGGGQGGPSQEFPSATGGTITTVQTDYKLHTFTSDGEFAFTIGYDTTYGEKVQFLMVAGGGGGGNSHSGGGGGGGYLYNGGYQHTLSQGTYPIVIGAEGQGGTSSPNNGTSGGAATFDTLSAAGGGRGGAYGSAQIPEANAPYQGGSGGGAGGGGSIGGEGDTPAASPFPSQGNDGGLSIGSHPNYFAGGGGGAGGNGAAGQSSGGGGGDGSSASPIDATGRAGGGSGSAQRSGMGATINPNPSGGPDGGGQGSVGNGQGTPDGVDNQGGGGGGAFTIVGTSGDGGTGIVLIQYKFQ